MQMRNTFPPALKSLEAFNLHEDHDKRHVLLRVMSDVFAACPEPTPQDCQDYEEMALALVEHVDQGTRAAVAQAVTVMPATPQALVDRLLALGGDAAAHLLEHCPSISPQQIIAFVAGAPSHFAVLAAQRENLDLDTARVLAKRTEPAVAKALAANAACPMDRALFLSLLPRARMDLELARALAPRAPSPEDAAPLFLVCDAPQRADILRFVRNTANAPCAPSGRLPLDAATRAQMETFALDGTFEDFCARVAIATGQSLTDTQRILADPSGEATMVLFAALGLSGEAVGRMLMTGSLFPSRKGSVVLDLVTLMLGLPQPAAHRLLMQMGTPLVEARAPRALEPPTSSKPPLIPDVLPALRS